MAETAASRTTRIHLTAPVQVLKDIVGFDIAALDGGAQNLQDRGEAKGVVATDDQGLGCRRYVCWSAWYL